MRDELFILTNSPGEVSGWVKPVASELSRKNISAKVILVVLPCQYASGMEKRYGRELEGIDAVFTFKELWSHFLHEKGAKKLVLQLGGDPFFGAVLATKLRCKWMIYTSRPKWNSRVKHYFVPDAKAEERFKAHGVKDEKFTRVGNLILDSAPECGHVAEARSKLGLEDGEEAISFLPGSRPFEYGDGFAFFCYAAKEVLNEFPKYHAFLPVAPTVDEELVKAGLKRAGLEWTGEKCAEEIVWNGPGRIRFIRGNNFEAIKASKLAVALPGTNNLQISSLGVPLLIVAPMNEVENIPLDGISGIIPMNVPGAKRLKKKLIYLYSRNHKFVSLTNRLTGKETVPEHRGIMTPSMVAGFAGDLLRSPEKLQEIIRGYSDILLERGAAGKIADKVTDYFRS